MNVTSPRNKFEKDIDRALKRLKTRAAYESEKLSYVLEGNYNPDWTLPDGTIVEGKGLFRAADRRKMVAIKKRYPERRIIICFYKLDAKLDKRSKTTYGEWALKNGFIPCTLETLADAIKY
jgi:hypothetical protein